jgi:hypothetical protein
MTTSFAHAMGTAAGSRWLARAHRFVLASACACGAIATAGPMPLDADEKRAREEGTSRWAPFEHFLNRFGAAPRRIICHHGLAAVRSSRRLPHGPSLPVAGLDVDVRRRGRRERRLRRPRGEVAVAPMERGKQNIISSEGEIRLE